jgi:hypothetical protein
LFSSVVVGLDNYQVVIFVLFAFGSAFGVAYWWVINSTSLSIAVHTIDTLLSRAVGFGVGFGVVFSLVPLVVMYCPFL